MKKRLKRLKLTTYLRLLDEIKKKIVRKWNDLEQMLQKPQMLKENSITHFLKLIFSRAFFLAFQKCYIAKPTFCKGT